MSEDISHIGGNASDKIKHFLFDRRKLFTAMGLAPNLEATFGDPVVAALKLSEISIHQNAVEPSSLEAKVTCKTRITQGFPGLGFSETIHVIFHAPAVLGEELQVVNTCTSAGEIVQSARTEIWSVTHHRLVVSGVHVTVKPQKPKQRNPKNDTAASKL
ncbi:hypothetical protein EV359DRAFT_66516 [Lentinula novae-zelandiae]|nr:hypothetical protein EV359DRAFT_66516 [Lentinula novae-zelandiae]